MSNRQDTGQLFILLQTIKEILANCATDLVQNYMYNAHQHTEESISSSSSVSRGGCRNCRLAEEILCYLFGGRLTKSCRHASRELMFILCYYI